MPPAVGPDGTKKQNGLAEESSYPSRNIAYQAAAMITSIIEELIQHDQLRYAPAFMYVQPSLPLSRQQLNLSSVYSLFSALLMHVYQLRSANPQIAEATQNRLNTCMNALKDISKVWLVGKMVHTLFESILGNKQMEERLQKASGKRHAKAKLAAAKLAAKTEDVKAPKRKYDDLDMFGSSQPAAQMSYERSRPVSPVNPPIKDANHIDGAQMPHMSAGSPPMRQAQDAFMGMSRSGTRASTPFNTYSYPGTPPDLFLHTRNSPNISQDLWQNYQPDQLFPPDSTSFGLQSPQQQIVDPMLRGAPQGHRPSQGFVPTQHMPGMPQMSQAPPMQNAGAHMQAGNMHQMPFQQSPGGWNQMQGMVQTPHDQRQSMASVIGDPGSAGQEDTWSNSSTGAGPIVPTTLNVGDW